MTPRRRRALASAVGALVVALLCAALSSNVDGVQRRVLIVLMVAWLVIAASCVANALRTARPAAAPSEPADEAEPL
jgi:DMSO reductase anchor subunit